MGRYECLIALLIDLLAGCSGTHEIVMAPPRPATVGAFDTTAAFAHLTLTAEADTALPSPFQTLTVTLRLLALQRMDGYRQPIPSVRQTLTFTSSATQRWTLLAAVPMPPGRYNALWIGLSDVTAHFSPNTSGSLIVETDTLTLPITLELEPNQRYTYRLRFYWKRSLQAEPDCHWRFAPTLHLE